MLRQKFIDRLRNKYQTGGVYGAATTTGASKSGLASLLTSTDMIEKPTTEYLKQVGKTPVKNFLPENGTGGIMIEKNGQPIVAGFIYETNSASILLEWIVSNPDYRDGDRQQAVEMLIIEAEKRTKELGYSYMFTIGRNKNLIETHRKLGWHVDDKPSHEIIKKL